MMNLQTAHTKKSLAQVITDQETKSRISYDTLYRNFEHAVASWPTPKAGRFAKKIENLNIRSLFFISLLIKLGELKQAKNVTERLENKHCRITGYRAICIKLAEKNQFEEAMHETKKIQKEITRPFTDGFVASIEEMCHGSTLEIIALKLFEIGRTSEALNYAQEIPYPIYRQSTLECMQNRRTLTS